MTKLLTDRAMALYHSKDQLFADVSQDMREVERVILLRQVDSHWMEHIDAMEEFKNEVRLNAYAQRSPISEYRITGAAMFDDMIEDIRESTVRSLLSVRPRPQRVRRMQVFRPLDTGAADGPARPVIRVMRKVGPNEPCPCGSGKKYKYCHGLSKGGN